MIKEPTNLLHVFTFIQECPLYNEFKKNIYKRVLLEKIEYAEIRNKKIENIYYEIFWN